MAGREHALQMQRGQQQQQPPVSARMTSISLKTEAADGCPQGGQPATAFLNLDYFRTIPGWLKVAQLFLGAICMGCGSPAFYGATRFYMVIAGVTFVVTALLSLARLLYVTINIPNVQWSLAEASYTASAAVLWLIASSAQLAMATNQSWRHNMAIFLGLSDQYIAAGAIGLLQTVAYGVGAFFLLVEWRASRPIPPPTSIPQS